MNDDFRRALAELAEKEGWGVETWDHRRGEHPPADLLVAYGSGELADLVDGDPQVGAIRDHVTTCRECAALVADLAAFPDLPGTGGEPSEEEMAEAWQELRQRLYREQVLPAGDEGPAAAQPDRPPGKAPQDGPQDGPAEADRRREPAAEEPRTAALPVRGRVGWALAAALLVLCVGLASWTAHLDRRLGHLAAPQPNVPLVELDLDRTRSGPGAGVEAEIRGPFYLLVLHPALEAGDEARFNSYWWRIVGPSGEVRLEGDRLELQPGRHFTLLLYRHALPPGTYRIEIFGRAAGRPEPVGEQELRIPGDG